MDLIGKSVLDVIKSFPGHKWTVKGASGSVQLETLFFTFYDWEKPRKDWDNFEQVKVQGLSDESLGLIHERI